MQNTTERKKAVPATVAKKKTAKNETAPAGPAPRLITITEASKAWGLPKPAIRKLCHQGKLRHFVGFKEWRFYENDIHQPGVLERL